MKKIDLTGERFGLLTVLNEAEPYFQPSGRRLVQWNCLCDCGNKTIVRTTNLRSGHTTSCGCACGRIDLINKKYGRLTVIKKLPNGYHLCRCDCGKEIKL